MIKENKNFRCDYVSYLLNRSCNYCCHNDYLMLSFVVLFSLACSTESMLELNQWIFSFRFSVRCF